MRMAKGECLMKITEIDDIERQHLINKETASWSELDRTVFRQGEYPRCFYCNFALECGQPDCIWCEK